MGTRKRRALPLTMLLCIVVVVSTTSALFAVHQTMAQDSAEGVELAYDDGIPYKTVQESKVVCVECIRFQGVRFGLGGVEIGAVTSVRFYAQATDTGNMLVYITDVEQKPLLPDPIKVYVSRTGWYTVPMPEVTVTGDFYIWLRIPKKSIMPMHDIADNSGRSWHCEDLGTQLFAMERDLLIRATVRADIHVGREPQYKYKTIQDAVNDAGPLLTIIVHPGTYTENVLVPKRLRIRSSDGPSVTFVQPLDSSRDVFDVTEDGVSIKGFTIGGSAGSQGAGIRLNDVSKAWVADNTISGNYYGMYLSESSTYNVLVQNTTTANTYGIWVGGQQNNICGNRTEGNTAVLGSGMYLSGTAADNLLRFNDFSSGDGTNRTAQVLYDGMFKPVDAIQNWWGDPTGPYHQSSNPGGTGVSVGEMIDFAPWLEAAPVAVKTGKPDVSDYMLDGRAETSTSVTLFGPGLPIIWIATYSGNPAGEFAATSIGSWIDVCLQDTGGVREVEVKVYYSSAQLRDAKEGNLRLYWWNGAEWVACSRQKVDTSEDSIRAVLSQDSSPNLSNLSGTPFAVGATAGGGFDYRWVLWGLLAIIGLVVAAVVVLRVIPRLLGDRGQYYDEEV